MTTIYVSPGENIQEAGDKLKPGDSLVLQAGIHYGWLIVPCDSLTISGEDGAVLEGTAPVPNQWEQATQSDDYVSLAGTGTWRAPVSEQPWVLLDAEGNMIHRIDSDYCNVKETNGYYYYTAFQCLAVPDNARPGPDYGADWWEGIEALWVYSLQDGHLYVRYRDGRIPENLRYSGGRSDHRQPPIPAASVIYCKVRSDIRIEGLAIAGCVDGIAIVDSSNVVIDSCMIGGCDFGVRVYGACENIKITHNELESALIGANAVAPISKVSTEVPEPESRQIAYHQYAMWKFWHDESDSTQGSALSIWNSWNDSTQTVGVPKQIEFAHNNVRHQAFAVDCSGGDGIDIHHNFVNNCWDMSFQRMTDGGRNIQIHDNECHEAGYGLFRWHASNQECGDNYVYNNRCSDIDLVSDFCFHSRASGGGDAHSSLRIWYYHNSFSGGHAIVFMDGMLSMPGFNAVNNVVSNRGDTWVAAEWPSDVGVVDHNFVTGQSGRSAAALGAPIKRRDGTLFTLRPTKNQQNAGGAIWPSDEIVTDFTLPDGHPAKGSGIDVSQPFVINGVTYDPLPGFEPGYFSGAAPDMGWINRGETNGGEPDVISLAAIPGSVGPGGDVVAEWIGSKTAKDWIGLFLVGAGDDDYIDWVFVNGTTQSTDPVPNGAYAFTMPQALGSYEFRFFENDALTSVAKSNVITVHNNPDPEPPTPGEDWVQLPAWVRRSDIPPET